jgi:hypothetical protein
MQEVFEDSSKILSAILKIADNNNYENDYEKIRMIAIQFNKLQYKIHPHLYKIWS